MFDLILVSPPSTSERLAMDSGSSDPDAAMPWRWLAATLDEVDRGMLLLGHHGDAIHINESARGELDTFHPLQLLGSQLRTRHTKDVARLHDALRSAERGSRRLVTLGDGEDRVSVSLVPLHAGESDERRATLLVLSKRRSANVEAR
jgi:hypothetical protein